MKDDVTNQEFHFHVAEWLRVEQEEVPAVLELAAVRPDIPPLEGQWLVAELLGMIFTLDRYM